MLGPVFEQAGIALHHGGALGVLCTLPDASCDALVTDPPAGISFMGKRWDHDHGGRAGWVAAFAAIFAECLRVLKPGAHGLVWALPRTSHWTATALEDAGFEVRDVVTHHFGSGFPKSLNLGDGRGTALKPASEHWLLVRAPLSESTIAGNVVTHGTGALNIDATRVPSNGDRLGGGREKWTRLPSEGWDRPWCHDPEAQARSSARARESVAHAETLGRWPANLILSHGDDCADECGDRCPVVELDAQSGELSSGLMRAGSTRSTRSTRSVCYGAMPDSATLTDTYGDTGGASRFFYIAKPPRAEKDAEGVINRHPTVKSIGLMRWLCRLVTPPGGIVLDPFLGSGTTAVAAHAEGLCCIGIEREREYLAIAAARVSEATRQARLALPAERVA